MRQVREAGYRRLAEARAAARTLPGAEDPRRRRETLIRILRLGKQTLDEGEGIAGPSLLSQVRMQMAAAMMDLAAIEADRERRSRLVESGRRACALSLRIALQSEAPYLAMKVFPWGMAVVAGGMRAARNGESSGLQRLMLSCANALPRIDDRVRRDARRAARTLFQGQLLGLAARRVEDPADRSVVLRRALAIATEARRLAIGAGDFVCADQTKATIADLEGRIAAAAAAASKRADTPPGPAPAPPAAKPFPKFCPNCGTPTRPGKAFCTSCGSRLPAGDRLGG